MMLRIKELREARGMSQTDLGKLLGTTGVSVGRYERDPGRVTVPMLEHMAKALQCRVSDLLGSGLVTDQPITILPYRNRAKKIAFDMEQAARVGDPANLQAIEMTDDTMAPTIGVGDACLIDSSINSVQRDGIFALELGGQTLIKRVGWNPLRGLLTISGDNPLYPPLGDASPGDVKIAGRVVWAGKKL